MFDPLYKWLGIPPDEQPPNHYRLLGISLFENDKDVIDAAADKHLAFLHEVACGENVAQAEAISNEISRARLVLLSDKKKGLYDSELRDGISSSSSDHTTAAPTQTFVVQTPPTPQAESTRLGWFLQHNDGNVHGPFPLDSLVEGVRTGRVLPETLLQQEYLTGDQWKPATEFQVISKHFTNRSLQHDKPHTDDNPPPVKLVTRRSPRSPSLSWLYVLFQIALPLIILVLPGYLIYTSPRFASIFGTHDPSDRPGTREFNVHHSEHPDSSSHVQDVAKDTVASGLNSSQITEAKSQTSTEANSPASNLSQNESPPSVGFFDTPAQKSASAMSSATDQGTLLDTSTSSDIGNASQTLIQAKFEIDSSFWQHDLGKHHSNGQYYVSHVDQSPSQIELRPDTGLLSFEADTQLKFVDLGTLVINLRLVKTSNDRLSVKGKWALIDNLGKSIPFSMSKVKNRRVFLTKGMNSITRTTIALNAERDRIQSFMKSPTAKRLDVAKANDKRVAVIKSQLDALSAQAKGLQSEIESFIGFSKGIDQLNERSSLVIRVVNPSIN